MLKNKEQLVYELAMKYVSKTFDFENKSPEDLLETFQDVHDKILKSFDMQNQKDSEFPNTTIIGGVPKR